MSLARTSLRRRGGVRAAARGVAVALLLTGAGLTAATAATAAVAEPTPSAAATPTPSASPAATTAATPGATPGSGTTPVPGLTQTPREATSKDVAATDGAPVTEPQSSAPPAPAGGSPTAALPGLGATGSVAPASATAPIGNVDTVGFIERRGDRFWAIRGWAVDPDEPRRPVTVHYYVDGGWGGSVTTDWARPDVESQVPGAGPNQGFFGGIRTRYDPVEVCAYAIDTTDADVNTPLGCLTIDMNRLPQGAFEPLTSTAGSGSVTLKGWAFDLDSPFSPVDVHYYVDGAWGGSVATSVLRRDVSAAFPGARWESGYTRTFTAGAGMHVVCVYAIDAQADRSTALGCQSITVGVQLPVGNVDQLTLSGSSVTLDGWTFDPDGASAAVAVHLYVYTDGVGPVWGGSLTTGVSRPDVPAAYPGAGSHQGFTASLTLGAGSQTVCAYAIDNQVDRNTRLGCRTVTVG